MSEAFVDTHCHVLPELTGAPQTSLPALLCSLAAQPTLLSAGMDGAALGALASGKAAGEEEKAELLRVLPLVAHTSVMRAVFRGILDAAGLPGDEISERNYDAVECALRSPPGGACESMARHGVSRALINVNNAQGQALFCGKAALPPGFSERFALIPTFDAHALHPDIAPTKQAAAHLGMPIETLGEYLAFVEAYLDAFLQKFPVAGLKVSEQYFRKLDYAAQSRDEAEGLYASPEGRKEKALLDFVTLHVFSLAQARGLTVQLHTGMLWGEADASALRPSNLCGAVGLFPGLRFDLLHLGFPHLGEAAVMALNAPNVSLNLSWLPLISEDMTADWLVRLLQILPVNKLTFGTDVFDFPSLFGTAELIRRIAARAAAFFPGREGEIERRLLHQNAEELYRL